MGTEIKANLPKGSFLCVFIMHIVRAFIAVKVIMRTHIKGDESLKKRFFWSCRVSVTFVHSSTLVPFIHHKFSAVIVKLLGIVYERSDRLSVITHADWEHVTMSPSHFRFGWFVYPPSCPFSQISSSIIIFTLNKIFYYFLIIVVNYFFSRRIRIFLPLLPPFNSDFT